MKNMKSLKMKIKCADVHPWVTWDGHNENNWVAYRFYWNVGDERSDAHFDLDKGFWQVGNITLHFLW